MENLRKIYGKRKEILRKLPGNSKESYMKIDLPHLAARYYPTGNMDQPAQYFGSTHAEEFWLTRTL